MNKLSTRVILLLAFSVYLILFSLIIKNEFFMKEGFNTYFRQTVRPQVRNLRDSREVVTYHFDTNFRDFRRSLGLY